MTDQNDQHPDFETLCLEAPEHFIRSSLVSDAKLAEGALLAVRTGTFAPETDGRRLRAAAAAVFRMRHRLEDPGTVIPPVIGNREADWTGWPVNPPGNDPRYGKTLGYTVKYDVAMAAAPMLVEKSIRFWVEPLPDNVYYVSCKAGDEHVLSGILESARIRTTRP